MKKICVLFGLFLCMGCIATQPRKVVTVPPDQESYTAMQTAKAEIALLLATPEGVTEYAEQTKEAEQAKETEETKETEEVPKGVNSSPLFMSDLPQTEVVDLYYHYYTQQHKKTFARWLDRAKAYLPEMVKIFRAKDLPEELVFLPFAESGFNPWAYSRAGAGGMWQFMPRTARGQGLKVDWWLDERRDPYKSTEAAANYLQYLYAEFGDWPLVLAAYNAGEGTVRRAISLSGQRDFFTLAKSRKKYFTKETRHYVPKFIAILKILRNLDALGFSPLDLDSSAQIAALPLAGNVNLKKLAAGCGLTWKDFTCLNPAFRRSVSSPDYKGFVYVPTGKKLLAQKEIKTLRVATNHDIKRYKVRSGESLWSIARKHDVHIQDLKKLNGLKNNLIQPGQWLLVGMEETVAPSASGKRATRKSKRAIAKSRANYRVQKGDSLWSIARKFGTSTETLLVANGLRAKSILSLGQKLYIPDGAVSRGRVHNSSQQVVRYNVRRGDTIWGIAKRFNIPAQKLLTWNRMKKNQILRPGTNLVLYLR